MQELSSKLEEALSKLVNELRNPTLFKIQLLGDRFLLRQQLWLHRYNFLFLSATIFNSVKTSKELRGRALSQDEINSSM